MLAATNSSDTTAGQPHQQQQQQPLQWRCEDSDGGAQLPSAEAAQLADLLAKHYRVPGRKLPLANPPASTPSQPQPETQTQSQSQPQPQTQLPGQQQANQSSNLSPVPSAARDGQLADAEQRDKPELPRPLNVTVLIISWYPPVLKLKWRLNELDESEATKLDFYHHQASARSGGGGRPANSSSGQSRPADSLIDQFDIELAIGQQRQQQQQPGNKLQSALVSPPSTAEANLMEELRARRYLVDKSLSCFQVTYNIINSRFKVTEEYPPYLRSIMLERLLPATEYSLRVAAVYLGGRYRALSDRVQFVSPTDNESRRFKENTYRPIQRYPDERRELRIGLAQVRSEELTIVVIAVVFWIATICLFFNKWGKIRMLEPYQPAYREVSPSPSFVAAHHHPSAHNLSAGGAGSCAGTVAAASSSPAVGGATKLPIFSQCPPSVVPTLATPLMSPPGSGSETAAMVGGAAAAAAASVAADQQPAGTTTPVPVTRCSDGGLGVSGMAGTGRKASRSLLLLANKRFESLASANDPAVSLRRTDTELNYLFQSKALALAKATSVWSRQQQKLRQLQYRTNLPVSLQQQQQQQPLQSAPDQQLEVLRRTSQALLRQRNLPTAATLAHCPPSSLKSQQPTGSSFETSCPQPAAGRATPTSPWRVVQLSHNRPPVAPTETGSDPQQQAGTRSLDYTDGPEAGGGETGALVGTAAPTADSGHAELQASSSNKMRRLLFITKSHQHHHIATSTSSTLLKTNSASLPNNNNNLSRSPTPAGSPLPGHGQASSSLDQPAPTQTVRVVEPPPPTSGGSGSSSSCGSTSSLPTAQARDGSGVEPRGLLISGRRPTQILKGSDSHLVEHHILIEPPSPPTQRDLLEQAAGPAPEAASVPAGFFVAAAAEPNLSHQVQQQQRAISGAGEQQKKQQQQQQQNNRRPLAGRQDEDNKSRSPDVGQLQLNVAARRGPDPAARQQRRSLPQAAGSGEWPEFDKDSAKIPAAATAAVADQAGLNYTAHNRPEPGGIMFSGGGGHHLRSAQSSSRSSSSTEQQPEICLEAPTEEDEAEQLSAEAAAGSSQRRQQQQRRRPSNEPFAKLASYQAAQASSQAMRRKLAGTQPPTASTFGPAAGKPAWAAQLSHSPDHHHHLRHQSFCCDCLAGGRLSPQCPELGGQQPAQFHQQHQRAASLSTRGAPAELTAAGAHWSTLGLSGDEQRALADGRDSAEPERCYQTADGGLNQLRPRVSSVFVASPYSRAHRDSFAMLRALSQKKSKSAEDVAYLSSLVLQIWVRDRNPLLQSVSQQHLASGSATGSGVGRQHLGGSQERHSITRRQRPKSSLTVAQI